MWQIRRTSGTWQEILIMAAMNLLHRARIEKSGIGRDRSGDGDRSTLPPLGEMVACVALTPEQMKVHA